MFEVFFRFLLLGCMSFGGPIAHIGYFQQEFVNKRKWLDETSFTSGLSLCQFLPGPASSQLGMYIGFQRSGYLGALAAFIGFTFPSFALLTTVAIYSANLGYIESFSLVISAAKLLAVVVVADAILTMGKKFITDKITFLICVLSTLWLLFQSGVFAQIIPILFAGIIGWFFSGALTKQSPKIPLKFNFFKHHISVVLLTIFAIFLIFPIMFDNAVVNFFQIFYQAGSFVFGGGHVVLPLLEPLIGDQLSSNILIEGYAAAQLVPGPMFTIASYLGASSADLSPVFGSVLATIAIFLPGALLLFAILPIWQSVMSHENFSSSVTLINAAVVGLLIAAFYQPVLTSAIHHVGDILVAFIGLILLRRYQLSIFWMLTLMLIYSCGVLLL